MCETEPWLCLQVLSQSILWSLTQPTVPGQLLAAHTAWEPFPASLSALPVSQGGTLGIRAAHWKYWWLMLVAQGRENLKLPCQGCGEKQQPQASLLTLTIVPSNFLLGETSLCFLPSIHSPFLLYYFYSCPVHHITPMPQKASELHANQDTEFALSWVKTVEAIQVSFLLR